MGDHADPSDVPVALHGGRGTRFAVLIFGASPSGHVRLLGQLDDDAAPILDDVATGLRADGFQYLSIDISGLTSTSPAGAVSLQNLRGQFPVSPP